MTYIFNVCIIFSDVMKIDTYRAMDFLNSKKAISDQEIAFFTFYESDAGKS